MKTMAWVLAASVVSAVSWQARAADVSADSSAQTAQSAQSTDTSMGGVPSAQSMSGGPSAASGLSRADVARQLEQFQKSGEAARMQDLYRGG